MIILDQPQTNPDGHVILPPKAMNNISDFISGSLLSEASLILFKDSWEHFEVPDLLTSVFCQVRADSRDWAVIHLSSAAIPEEVPLSLQDNFGFDLPAVEAATKKHEAIETDIAAYEERVQAVVAVAKELETENYHDIKRITARKDNVIRLWEYLLELLRARRQRLEMNLGLQKIFQEMLYIMDWMDEMKVGASPLRMQTKYCSEVCVSLSVKIHFAPLI